MAVWIIGGLLTLFGGAVSVRAGGRLLPPAESTSISAKRPGPMVAFLFGWSLFIVIESGTVASWPWASRPSISLFRRPVAVAVQDRLDRTDPATLTAVNYRGVRKGAGLMNFLMVIKFVALIGMRPCLPPGQGNAAEFSLGSLRSGAGRARPGNFGVALIAALWAYGDETSS